MEDKQVHDLIIIGAGPAALSAAVYTTREDIETLVLEKGVIGGLAAITDSVENYPGFPDGISGLELADRLRAQAERFGTKIEYGDATKIENGSDVKKVYTADNKEYLSHTVLITTGNNYKRLEAEGEKEYYGKGVHYCATCDGPLYKGKRLVVVGGGNSAAQETLFLARLVEHVDILIRKDQWRASDILVERIAKTPNITVHFNTEVSQILGEGNFVKKVVAKNSQTNENIELATDGVFVFIGLVPNTQFLAGSGIELDERGFVKTNEHLGTNVLGIFCAGDVRSGATEQIASAVGEGATAALTIREYLDQVPARKHGDHPHQSMQTDARSYSSA
ncbi:thioredoxin-disulfide reductase [Candidatus Saccharibacteria bacterium]|nr:thioredoxin-disulfide reductase [Candidatus Saccharibacteria bacterium]